MHFQILLCPAEDFEGDIVLTLSVHPVSFRPARSAMDYGQLTRGTLLSHLPPTTDKVGKLSVACNDLRKALGYGSQVDP